MPTNSPVAVIRSKLYRPTIAHDVIERRRLPDQAALSGAVVGKTATAENLENFKNAFSVCLEAREYMVKYQARTVFVQRQIIR